LPEVVEHLGQECVVKNGFFKFKFMKFNKQLFSFACFQKDKMSRDMYEADAILTGMIWRLRGVSGKTHQVKELEDAWECMWTAFNAQKEEIKKLKEELEKAKKAKQKEPKWWEEKGLAYYPDAPPASPVPEEKEEKKMPELLYKKKEGVEVVGFHRSSEKDVWVGKMNFE